MEMTATLHIRRIHQWLSMFRKFRIELDGDVLGKIKNGGTQEFRISPGEHELVIGIDWVSSDPVKFRCDAGDQMWYACGHPTPTWRSAVSPANLVGSILIIPDRPPSSSGF